MTSFVEARDVIVATVQSAWPAAYPQIPVFYDNAMVMDLVDLEEFLGCNIDFSDSEQADIGPTPFLRNYGMLSLVLGVKKTVGSRTSLSRADFLQDVFRFKKIGGLTFGAPHLTPASPEADWYLTELVVPFHFDD